MAFVRKPLQEAIQNSIISTLFAQDEDDND